MKRELPYKFNKDIMVALGKAYGGFEITHFSPRKVVFEAYGEKSGRNTWSYLKDKGYELDKVLYKYFKKANIDRYDDMQKETPMRIENGYRVSDTLYGVKIELSQTNIPDTDNRSYEYKLMENIISEQWPLHLEDPININKVIVRKPSRPYWFRMDMDVTVKFDRKIKPSDKDLFEDWISSIKEVIYQRYPEDTNHLNVHSLKIDGSQFTFKVGIS
jgi:hypothetical protein